MTITGLINGLVVLIDGENPSLDNVHPAAAAAAAAAPAGAVPAIAPVPLTGVEVNSRVVNFTAHVDVIQTYVNKESNPIEAIYFFPIEEAATVIAFTAEVEGREIKAIVREKEIARTDYQAAVKDRKTAVLLEETTPDVFQINIGQLGPGAGCKISITYICELPVENGKTRLTIPTTVAPRYVPANDFSSTASSISSIQHSHESPAKMKLDLEILMKTRIENVESPSHGITNMIENEVDQQGYFIAKTGLEGTTANLDKDLVILIETQEPYKPKILVETGPENTRVAMLSFVPKFKIQEQSVEMIFLVDCSGSMNGKSMELVKEALKFFLHSLPVNCYFNIIRFGSKYQSLFEKSQLYDDNNLLLAKKYAAETSANLGGTEILRPLEEIFRQSPIQGYSKQVFILTDGDVSNSSDCIKIVKDNAETCRVFSLGVGSSASRHLVKGMSRAGHGTAVFATYGENLGPKILNQLSQALQPCIRDITVKWQADQTDEKMAKPVMENNKTLLGKNEGQSEASKEKFSSGKQAPDEIPAIYDGHRLLVYNMYMANEKMPQSFEITAKTPEGPLYLKIDVDEKSNLEGKMIHQMFARKLIQDLEESFSNRENQEEARRLVIEMGVRYSIASKFTSFIGVDFKQNKEVGVMLTRQVKNQMPAGFGGMSSMARSIDLLDDSDEEEDESFRRNGNSSTLLAMGGNSLQVPELSYRAMPSKPSTGINRLLELIDLQLAEGAFRKDEKILERYIGKRIDIIVDGARVNGVAEEVWITALLVAIIEGKFDEEKDNWMLSVEKAKTWIRNQGKVPEEIIQKAKVFMQYINVNI